jgi:MFS family permease
MAYALAVYSMGANAMIVFTPAFLMRTHGLTSAGAGLALGLVYGVAGVAGVLLGGLAGDLLGRRDPRWRMWAPGIGLAVAVPFTLGAWLVPSATWSVLLLAVPKFANLLYFGPVFVALQSIAPLRIHATASAFLLFFNSLIGQMFGPFIVGFLSDALEPMLGTQSLRYALCFVVLTQVVAALHFVVAARTLMADAHPP